MNIGAIAIGSNSTRLLTRLENGLEDRAREDTKLFSGLNEDGNLSDEAMDRTVRAVLRLKKRAIQFGAEYIMLLATSATRDAGNSEEFSRRLLAGTGLRLKIISGNKEAELAFRAASAGSQCAVLDIGGGSAELTYGAEGKIIKSISAQEGASRLLKEGEILSVKDAERVYGRVISRLRTAYAPILSLKRPPRLILIGGTATTAAAIQLVTDSHGQELEGTQLTKEQAREQLVRISSLSLNERANIPGLYPSRVHIMPHGLCILLAALELTGFDSFTVSTRNNLDAAVEDPDLLTGLTRETTL